MSSVLEQKQSDQAVSRAPEQEVAYKCPDVNIYETEAGYVLEAEMPGVRKENLGITLEGHTLVITGHRSDVSPNAAALYREARPADFRRVFELDPSIEAEKIRAQMNQGILTLELPKAEAVKPRQIVVE